MGIPGLAWSRAIWVHICWVGATLFVRYYAKIHVSDHSFRFVSWPFFSPRSNGLVYLIDHSNR